MKYTEIPTDLLVQASNVLAPLGYQFGQADFNEDMEITQDDMIRLMPLIKWLDYFDATTWPTEAAEHQRHKEIES